MNDAYYDCPVCHAPTELVNRDRGEGYVEEVYICDGDPGHQIVVSLGDPVIDEIRDENGDVMPLEVAH